MPQCSAEGQEPLTPYSKKIAPVEEALEQPAPIKPQPRPAKVEAAQMNGDTDGTDGTGGTDVDGEEVGQDRGAERAKLLPKIKEDGSGNEPVEESWGCRKNDLGG